MDYIQTAKDRVKSSDRGDNKQGISCEFYKLNEFVGAKFYYSQKECVATMRLQQLAYMLDIGPQVMSDMIVVETRSNTTLFGYLTEIICVHSQMFETHSWEIDSVYEYICSAASVFKQYGLYLTDMHSHNFGWTERGFTVLDFDHVYPDDNMVDDVNINQIYNMMTTI